MNFREAIRRLALVAGVGVIVTIIGGASLAPSKSSVATTFLFSVAAKDADEMKTTASDILRVYRANLGSSDEEILKQICSKTPVHQDTCDIYTAASEEHWKKVLLHWLGTIGIALGVGIAILLLWKILDWVIAGLGVSRA